jgi:hypothetical protein
MSKAAFPRQRRHLHFDALVRLVRQRFQTIPDARRSPAFSLADTLMAGLALFSLKDASLLAFCRRCVDHNLRSVFGLTALPSDTQMRVILDEVDPVVVRPVFRDLFRQVQRAKLLEEYVFWQGSYLIALDGVEYFCSKKVHCDHCLTRTHSNGAVSFYHQMLGAVLVHPDRHEVIPLCPEPIQRQDGQTKNDCERNAARRWLKAFRREHPHLSVIITEDGLSSNGPHIRDLKEAGCHFILGVKPGDHPHLFRQLDARIEADAVEQLTVLDTATGLQHSYLFTSAVELNEANPDLLVNVLYYVQTDPNGKVQVWTWVTDLQLTRRSVASVMRGGRARWKVENETFNTLKNQGYHYEHNYGHGEKHLAVVFAYLMMLAFLIDQLQQRSNALFQKAQAKAGTTRALWECMRHLFYAYEVASMREIYEAIAFGYERARLRPQVEQKPTATETVDSS